MAPGRRPPWGRAGPLPPNLRSWSPRRIICLDVEGTTRRLPDGSELDTFRLAVASLDPDRRAEAGKPAPTWHLARTPRELWEWVHRATHPHWATWVWSHGWHYDLPTSAAERELERLGWRLQARSDEPGARWYRWRRGSRVLVMVDLANYVMAPLAVIGQVIGRPKLAIPPPDAPAGAWERYCRRDVEVLREAVLRLLDWWDREDGGEWAVTGAGLSMAAYRHRFLPARGIRRHDDPVARSLERRALYGGRAEIWRHGRLPGGVWVELDYVSHYLATAWEVAVPRRLIEVWGEVPPDVPSRLPPRIGAICEVEVEVSDPVVPYRHPRLGVLWPVGQFRTCLAGPELELAQQYGRIAAIRAIALYELAPVLERWAEWLWARVHGPALEPDPLVRGMLKDWTRTLIGKFGQRVDAGPPSRVGVPWGDRPELEVIVGAGRSDLPWVDTTPADPERGGEAWCSMPALTAWVHSAARVTLWHAAVAAGRDAIAYLDTDALLVRAEEGNLAALAELCPDIDPTAPSIRAALPTLPAQARAQIEATRRKARPRGHAVDRLASRRPGRMAVKGIWADVVIYRQKDYVLDEREVITGVPHSREKIGERRYQVLLWPGPPWQRVHAGPGHYLRPRREVQLGTDYDRGWVLSDGRVVPLELEIRAGAVRVVPWSRTRWARAGLTLADEGQADRIAAADRHRP